MGSEKTFGGVEELDEVSLFVEFIWNRIGDQGGENRGR